MAKCKRMRTIDQDIVNIRRASPLSYGFPVGEIQLQYYNLIRFSLICCDSPTKVVPLLVMLSQPDVRILVNNQQLRSVWVGGSVRFRIMRKKVNVNEL